METEKLYSPVFCEIVANDNLELYDNINYYADEISQTDAANYADEIHEAILKERMPGEEERGLMTYYHGNDSVNDKVRSLLVDVEVHGGKLWGVATIALTESLTMEELDTLRDYISGQYSDGFGEGFEQCEIEVSEGELSVHLWAYDHGNFFIDTEREFRSRLGLETPSQAALYEPDTSDSVEAAALSQQLTERLDDNLSDYFDTLRSLDIKEIIGITSEIGAKMEAHYYLTEIHNFHTSELEYLLKFQDPLEVVADEFLYAGTDSRSDIMWKIFDRQEAIQGDYPLMKNGWITYAPSAMETAETQDALFERIAKKHCFFETLETRKRDSLDFREVSVWGMKAALEEAYETGAAHQIARANGIARTAADYAAPDKPAAADKRSVLKQIREAAKAPKGPHKDKPARDKSGPEL